MNNEPRVYSHSESDVRLQVTLGVLVAFMMIGVGIYTTRYVFVSVFGVAAIAFGTLHTIRIKTVISDDEIRVQNIFGEKSIRWDDIGRVSGVMGGEIRLHNRDDSVRLSPSMELAGYEEVIPVIGEKRPDLFEASQWKVFKKNFEYGVILPVISLLLLILSVYLLTMQGLPTLFFIPLLGASLFILGMSVWVPLSVTMDGTALRIKYLLNERTLSASEIRAVKLEYRQSKNSKIYYVNLHLSSGQSLQLTGVGPCMPIVYLTIGNWHRKNA